jgi:hypothetical protein
VNYQQTDWLMMGSPSTPFAEDSRAKTSALPEKEPDSQALEVASGGSSTASSRKRGRSGSSRKTYQPFAVEDWTKFSGASLRSGTMRNGTVYPLPPLALLTDATASGLWPTPTANSSNQCSVDAALKEAKRLHPQGRWTLMSQVAAETVHGYRMWPTPDASPHKYRLAGNSQQSRSLNGIHGGKLNPTWVEWLMGFPLDWTDLKHWGTRSSRKSQKLLEG